MTRPPGHDVPTGDPRTTGEVVQDVIDETRTLIRHEIALAKMEVRNAAAAKVQALAGALVAAVLAVFMLAFLLSAGASALDLWLPAWASRLIVAGVLLALIVGLLLFARSRATAPVAPRITETLKEDAAWAKSQLNS